jgi:hypothetical protein
MKFEIQPPKKFEIQSSQKKDARFKILHEWFKQNNSNDCGPCLLLNSLKMLNVNLSENSISEMRARVNEFRIAKGQGQLQKDGWFNDIDMERILEKYDFDVTTFGMFEEDKKELLESIKSELVKSFDLIISTAGSHFRGIINNPSNKNKYLLLDSFQDGPQDINYDEMMNFIERNFINTQDRVNKIIIARKKHSEIEI